MAYSADEIIPKDVTIRLSKFDDEPPISFDKETEKGIVSYDKADNKLDEKLEKLRDTLYSNNNKFYISNGEYSLHDISKSMSDSYTPLTFVVVRDGKTLTLNPINTDKDGKIGVQLESREVLVPAKGIKAVFKTSTKYLWDNTYYMVYGLCQIFTGKVPLKDLHGIVAITKVGGDVIENSGIFYGLLLTAIISMDLAIVNFLPIPALDGGHILFLIIEKIRGKKLKDETVEKIGTFFFALLIVLMVLIIINDILWLKG